MKRVLTLAIMSAALAFAATPAMAGLPYGDTNPNHYSAVSHVPSGSCLAVSCQFTGDSDLTHTLEFSTLTRSYRCQNPAVDYLLQSSGGDITNFEITGFESGDQCESADGNTLPGWAVYGGDHAICAYSANGAFTSNTQFWVRNDFGTNGGNPALGAAFGRLPNRAGFPSGYTVIDTITYTNQQIGDNLAPGFLDTWTVNGTVDVDSENAAFQSDNDGGTCSAFPEL
jgi:hypothetical protein